MADAKIVWCTAVAMIALVATGCLGEERPVDNRDNQHANDSNSVNDNDNTNDPVDNTTDPRVPSFVEATSGDDPDAVVVTWEGADDADAHEILRDGDVIAQVEPGATEFVDTEADPPAAPEAPYDVVASDDRSEGVVVSWAFDEPQPGGEHDYAVRAVIDGEPHDASATAVGYRGVYPYTFEVHTARDDQWRLAGTETEWVDEEASYGDLIDAGHTEATKGVHVDRVFLSIIGMATTPGDDHHYRVRVVDGEHAEQVSSTVTGRRGSARPDIQWQRSTTDDPANFEEVADADSAPYGDTDAPADGQIRYWRAELEMPDGDGPVYTEPDWGFRAIDCGIKDDFEGEYDDSASTLADVELTEDANIDALWSATVPAYNDDQPQQLQPTIIVENALVTATSFRDDQQFWIQDADASMHVFLDEPLDEEVVVGQRVSFEVTHMSVHNGNPEVSGLVDFTVESAGSEVPFHDLRSERIVVDDHLYDLVRVGGRLHSGEPCGGDYTCYELRWGPEDNRESVTFRTNYQLLKEDACVTFVGPVIAFLGPMHPSAETPDPQLQTDLNDWMFLEESSL